MDLRDALDRVVWRLQAPSIETLTLLAAAAAATTWLVEPWWVPAGLGLLALAGAVAHAPGPGDRTLALAGLASWASVVALWAGADAATLAGDRLVLEATLPAFVAATGVALGLLVDRIVGRTEASPLRMPFAAIGVFAAGAALRWLELDTIVLQADVALMDLVLRHDLAAMAWAVAGTMLALQLIYAQAIQRVVAWTPSLKKTVAALVVGLALLSHIGYSVGSVAVTAGQGRPPIQIGAHADHVEAVPASMEAIHLEVKWEQVQPEPGTWNWTAYDRRIRDARQRGLSVLLLTGMAPPPWVIERHRDAVMVDQDGDPFHWIDEAPGEPRDRIWDLSYADPQVEALRMRFLERTVERYASADVVDAVAVMNEPAYPPDFNPFRLGSYDNATVAAFRDHLRDRYANVSAFNQAAGTNVTAFAEVEPPDGLGGAYGRIWQRFREQTIVDHVRRAIAVADDATDKPVTVKIMAHYLARFARPQTALTERVVEALVGMSDIVAVDLYPVTLNDLERSLNYYRGLAGDKPLWVTEFNYALGPNLPTMGARTHASLRVLAIHAERVFFFTAEDHYLYGLKRYPSQPSLVAIELYQTPTTSREFLGLQADLLVHEVTAIANLYMVYATGSAFFGIPVAPWPVLLVAAVPLPKIDGVSDRRKLAGRAIAAATLWLILLATGWTLP